MNSRQAQSFFQRWAINTLAVLVAAQVVTGIEYDTAAALFIASLLLGVLHTFVRPILLLLSLPLLLFTLWLFSFVINAGLLYLVGMMVKGFHVAGFWPAFWGAILISFISVILNSLTGSGEGRIRVQRTAPPSARPPRDGGGPVIDV